MAFRIDLTLDCAHPTKLAEFWKLALGYEDRPPPAPFTTREEWLASFDLSDDDQDDGAWLHDPHGAGPNLFLQQVREPKVVKNRLHLDVRVARGSAPEDRWRIITEAAARLVTAGGSIIREHHERHIVMADPEGNEFCVA